jgi:hypothetical protein
MKYYATKITPGDQTIGDITFKKDVEVEVDHCLHTYLSADKKNYITTMRNEIKSAPASSNAGGPIEKVDLGSAVKPSKSTRK